MNKIFYEKPTVELLVVRFEENIMSVPNRGKGGISNISQDNGDVIDDSEGWI